MVTSAAPFPPSFNSEPLAGNYFVAVYPPFSCWSKGNNYRIGEALETEVTEPLGLYIHLPFCQRKCDYCYYLSYVGKSAETIQQYLDHVIHELALYAGNRGVAGRPLSFIYFGGGTPSLLSNAQVRWLTDGLKEVLPWNGAPEVTYECAPRSVRPGFLEELRRIGVTRLSMGVQSFDDTLLKLNGRVHLAEDSLRAWNVIRNAGVDWVNLDLMVGLIGETPKVWYDSIRKIIDLSPDSITIYQTEIPYNTQLYRDFKNGNLAADPVGWEAKRVRLNNAFIMLEEAGYTVMSAYTAVKDPSRHRFQYQQHLWRGGDMLGLGVASFSYFRGVHFQNVVTLEEYSARISRHELPWIRSFPLGPWDQLVREFTLQLKWGEVDMDAFQRKFGVDLRMVFAQPLQQLAAEGCLFCTRDKVRLTRSGLLRADRILREFHDLDFQFARYT